MGEAHGDTIRNIYGVVPGGNPNVTSPASGAFSLLGGGGAYSGSTAPLCVYDFSTERVVPTASKIAPRHYGVLACVYLGRPK